MNAPTRELVEDELDLVRRVLPLAGARVADIGCGNAALSMRLLQGGHVASVAALEVDRAQHAKNLALPPRPGLSFVMAGADAIPFPEASFDVVLMFKSLHHVPLDQLDTALAEIARVLVPGGLAYFSEPVFAGAFNEVMRVFHDEERVRAEAQAALARARSAGVLEGVQEIHFDSPIAFRDFDAFMDRIVNVTHTEHRLEGERLAEVRRRFEPHLGPAGARFERPMHVSVMRRPA